MSFQNMTKSQVKAVLVLLRMAGTKFGFNPLKFMNWLNNLKLFFSNTGRKARSHEEMVKEADLLRNFMIENCNEF